MCPSQAVFIWPSDSISTCLSSQLFFGRFSQSVIGCPSHSTSKCLSQPTTVHRSVTGPAPGPATEPATVPPSDSGSITTRSSARGSTIAVIARKFIQSVESANLTHHWASGLEASDFGASDSASDWAKHLSKRPRSKRPRTWLSKHLIKQPRKHLIKQPRKHLRKHLTKRTRRKRPRSWPFRMRLSSKWPRKTWSRPRLSMLPRPRSGMWPRHWPSMRSRRKRPRPPLSTRPRSKRSRLSVKTWSRTRSSMWPRIRSSMQSRSRSSRWSWPQSVKMRSWLRAYLRKRFFSQTVNIWSPVSSSALARYQQEESVSYE